MTPSELFFKLQIGLITLAASSTVSPARAQAPVTVKALAVSHGTLVSGDVTFSNFEAPAVAAFPHPQGAAPNDGSDLQVSTTVTPSGRVGLIFTLIDPITGTPRPLSIDAANGPTNFVRDVNFDVTATNAQLLLHTIDESFGVRTVANADAQIAGDAYYVEPGTTLAGMLISDSLVSGNLTRGGLFVPEGGSLLPGGNLATFRFGLELELISNHHGGVRTGTASIDSASITFALVPSGSPVPPVSVKPFFVGANASIGGTVANGIITLTNPAQAGGATVTLGSNNPALASVPATVTVPQGATTGGFPIVTSAVSNSGTTVGLSAALNGTTVSGFIQLFPAPPLAVSNVSLNPASVVGGSALQGTVTLTTTSADPVIMSLTSNNPAVVSLPATVVVPAGALSVGFAATTAVVTAPAVVNVTASDHTSSVTASEVVNPVPAGPLPVFTLSVGTSSKGTVTATPSGNDRALNCGKDCSAKFNAGTSVTLTAVPPAGKTFINWANACAAATNSQTCTVTINQNTQVQAVFSK